MRRWELRRWEDAALGGCGAGRLRRWEGAWWEGRGAGSAQRGEGASAAGEGEAAVGLDDDLRWARAAVVGRGKGRGVGAGVGDDDEVATAERRELVVAEVVGGLADRALDTGGLEAGRGGIGVTVERPTERCQRHDLVPGVVERGPDQLAHAGVQHDLATATSADVQDARDEEAGAGDEGAAGLDREALRASIGRDRLEQRRQLPRESRGSGGALAEGQDREPATDIERVESRSRAAEEREEREAATNGVSPGIDRAELRSDVEVHAARHERASGFDDLDRRRELVSGHPELGRPGADREAGERLGRDLGVEAEEDVAGGAA